MGSFSWTKADNLTNVANIVYGKSFKFLIPEEFGGGFIKDNYRNYGILTDYDMYELLAMWNFPDKVKYDGEYNPMKKMNKYTRYNRLVGIDNGCYDEQIDELRYPLKLVSSSYEGTYEECNGRSYGDPNQGFYPLYREK